MVSVDFTNTDSVVITSIKKRRLKLPRSSSIGEKYLGVIIGGLSKPASTMLKVLVEERDINTNETKYVVEGVNARCQLTKAYAELKKKDIVVRIKQQHYFINPSAVFPKFDRFSDLKLKWDYLKSLGRK